MFFRKKLLLLFGLLTLNAMSFSSPRCLDHQTSSFKSSSRKSPLEIVDCSCPCQNYPRSQHADGYKCLVCEHRLLPSSIEPLPNKQSSDNLIPATDAFIAKALISSTQRFYNESKQKPRVAKSSTKAEDAWMTF